MEVLVPAGAQLALSLALGGVGDDLERISTRFSAVRMDESNCRGVRLEICLRK